MNSVWRKELEALTAKPEERFEAFYKDIAFGTGGLRAVMGPGRNRINHFVVGRITQGLANYLNRHNPDKTPRVCIAFDTRNYGEAFARHTASVLCANGIKVMLFDQTRPTPMLSYAVRKHKADAGIVITASHNTKRYNGYKVYNATGGQLTGEAANEVTEEIERLDYFHDVKTMDRSEAENQGLLTLMKREMDDAYLADQKQWLTRPKYIRKNGNKIRILYTPLHGTGLLPVTSLLSELGFRDVHVVREQRDADGDFPTVYKPNPEDKNVFAIALEQAKSLKPDLIFATDPDADRLGVLSKGAGDAYEILTGTQLGALLTDYIIKARLDCENMPKNPAVVSTIVTGTLAEHICNANNVSYHKVLTGFKYIGEKMDEFKRTDKYSFLFGFEESYGYLTGDSCRDKDAVLTSALVSEAALWYKNEKDMTLWQAMQALYAEYRPVTERLLDYEFLGADGIKTMSAFMDNAREKAGKLIKGESVTFIEDYLTGERTDMSTGEQIKLTLPKSNVLKLFFADGAWLVLRPSGTEPKLKLYLCTDNAFSHGDSLADAEARLEALIDKTVKLLPPDARKHRKPA
ncbi:MAG: phospho-sugar mutase [Oscillospiraceae bacterium]|nr:phospho-sugar mutase [Oscillospiraceae bacterium]